MLLRGRALGKLYALPLGNKFGNGHPAFLF
jgi:hypothetical protein